MAQVRPNVRVATRRSSVVRRVREDEGVVMMPCSRERRQRRRASSTSLRSWTLGRMEDVVVVVRVAMVPLL